VTELETSEARLLPGLTGLKLAYIVTEDWAFYRHRLPMARAARAAGFEVHVLTRVAERRNEIEREGFTLHAMPWARSRNSPAAVARDIAQLRATLRAIAPAVVHNVALKPALLGSLAVTGLGQTAVINSITGLGSTFLDQSLRGRAVNAGVGLALRALLARTRSCTVVQNPQDYAAIAQLGLPTRQIVLIPGSGVDTDTMQPLPEPPGPVTVAYVGRMLDDKGVRPLVEAHQRLRAKGLDIVLLLAGEPDPENPTSIPADELAAWARLPGIRWLGHVETIADVWRQSHIAVLASLREGLPKSLLEAAAFGRPMVATNVPGCREIARHGETGLLVPVDDPTAIAAAIETLATDAALRHTLGGRARELALTRFSAHLIERQTAQLYCAMATTGRP
jgi:glycosyltransferase involved in cell wall biosynthesis